MSEGGATRGPEGGTGTASGLAIRGAASGNGGRASGGGSGESGASGPRYGEGDTSYRAAGGQAGLTRLVDAFYRIMDELPEARGIRRMHPRDLTEARDKLTRFLCGWLNGPRLYSQRYGPINIPSAHAHLRIGPRERDAWLRCMALAIAEQDYAPDFAAYLLRALAVPAERVRQTSRDPIGSEEA